MSLPPARHLLISLVASLAFACSSDDGQSGEPSVTPASPAASESGTPAPTPRISLTPSATAPLDIARARSLEAEGSLRAAAESYIAIAAGGGSNRSEATMGAARVLLELEQPVEAQLLLEQFLASTTGTEQTTARYMLARSYAAQAMWAQSLGQYDLYIQSGGPALPYAQIDRANVLLQLGRPYEAAEAAEAGLETDLPESMQRRFILLAAQAYERAGDPSTARIWYERLMEASSVESDDALALSRIAEIARDQLDPAAAQISEQLLRSYPSTDQALSELEEALERSEIIDASVRGLVYYRHGDYQAAELAFQEQITDLPDHPDSAMAHYYLGAIEESRDRLDEALAHYARVVSLNPTSPLADDALWWQARILEARDQESQAIELLTRIVNDYPQTSWGPEAAFRRGMLAYTDKRYSEAADLWSQGLEGLANRLQQERLSFWEAKAWLAAKDQSAARPLLERLVSESPSDYYGLRARSLLEGRQDLAKATRESRIDLRQSFDWRSAEQWLSQKTGRPVLDDAWISDPRWLRARELWTIGRTSQADAELSGLMADLGSDPIAMYTLSRRLSELNHFSLAASAGELLVTALDTRLDAGLPKALLSLSYPAPYVDLVESHAKTEDLSPLLLLALIRQESAFDPGAGSSAGALGLMQILPSTGRDIAQKLRVPDFDEDSLYEAATNLRFGSHYLAEQLDEFDQELFVSLAAYNGGPTAAARWRKQSGKDADVFLESIEFSESQRYVELVSENYAIYRYIYAGETAPTLPK